MLVNTYRLFKDFPEVRRQYVERFRYVLVDEFQDTNYVQACIVWQLTQERKAVCVVGDDAQSIYSFRGANIGNILGFAERYGGAEIFKLEQNYRSTRMIVNAANSLIAKNSEQIKKNVYSERGEGSPLELYPAYSDLEEVEIVANKIADLRRREGLKFSDFAILYRTNAQSRVFEEAFRRRAFPYRIFGGLSFYQRKEVKDVIAYFRLICNKDDEEAFKRIINYPARGIGDKTVQKVKDLAIERGMSLWQVLADPFLCGLDVNKGTLAKLMQFTGMIEGFSKLAEKQDALEVARAVVKDSGLREELYRDMSVEGKSRQENLEALMAAIEDFVEMHLEEGNEQNGLADFLSEVSLMSDIEDNDKENDGDRITLMTVHSAKGLEFPTVFVVGLEEDLFPNSGARESLREMEEERRLLYVAITRAKDYCVLSFAKSRYKYGQFGFCEPSCFIKEINPTYIVMPNGGGVQQRQQQQSPRTGGMFGATNSGLGRRSAYNYGQEENGRPQFSRTGGVGSAAAGRAAQQQRTVGYGNTNGTNSAANSSGSAGTGSYTTSRPANLYRVTDVQRYSQGSGGGAQPGVSVGAIVQHERFGIGEVLTTEGVGENAKATIKFQNAGVKTLLLKFAKLKIIG